MTSGWSAKPSLRAVQGPLDEHPPVQVMFLAHCHAATGRLTIRMEAGRVEIDVQNGRVVGISGIPRLLASVGIEGAPGANLEGLLGAAFQAGVPLDQSMQAAADGLGDVLAMTVGKTGGAVHFEMGMGPRGAPMVLPVPIPRIIAGGLQRTRHPEVVRRQLSPVSNRRVLLRPPTNTPSSRWGLSPIALRLVRRAEEQPTLNRLLRTAEGVGRAEEWAAADLLMQLGMLDLQELRGQATPEAAPEPAPLDHTKELKAALSSLQGQRPWEVLELKVLADVTDPGIERAVRTISSRFHPDRFASDPPSARTLAERCFAQVMEAGEALASEALREEVKARLDAELRGEQYVTEQERKDAEMAYARGQVAFRRRQFDEAVRDFRLAHSLDPEPWRHRYMLTRSEHSSGARSGVEVAEELLELVGPRGTARADVLFEAGEILLREGLDDRAYDTFSKIVEIYPDHIGARRHLRLRKKRARSPEDEGSSGLLSGLFGRRKR
ncbi:MAG: tetratricopeptide (TPR) repeat protein [Myxococcota bacterium]|jgi:tetratricopeptide (TPR) repeat protein